MKIIKKISYQDKYNKLIKEYGEDKGTDLYYKFLRGTSLEKCILKYGEDKGNIEYEKIKIAQHNSYVSLEKMILKYGEEEGKIKYDNWKLNTRQDLNGFIRRYGEEEGKNRYEKFKSKSLKALENVDRKSILNARTIEYWLNKYDNNFEISSKKLKEYQNNSSLDKYIKRYGEEDGKLKYLENNKKKSITLENMVKLYGEIDGKEKYEIWKNSNINGGIKYKEKYGDDEYKKLLLKRTSKNHFSNIGLEFCNRIYDIIKNDYVNIYFGENEYKFYIWEDDIKLISPDFYIKDINLVIEFYGDFWHKNPILYNEKQEFVKETWSSDEKRINKIKDKFNSDIIIIWEKDYKQNKEKVIQDIIEKIKQKYGNS